MSLLHAVAGLCYVFVGLCIFTHKNRNVDILATYLACTRGSNNDVSSICASRVARLYKENMICVLGQSTINRVRRAFIMCYLLSVPYYSKPDERSEAK